MSNLQLTWSEVELLASDDVAEPLVAGGVRCHGGFADDGGYVSPRAKNRVPATKAWQQSHRELFGADILDAPIELWPEAFPNVAQTRYLLCEGIPGPTISALTRIGTVEGFGSMIRAVNVEKMQRNFAESIDGTAIAHLQRGLFEAHARDEAGWEEEAGHRQMWFAARDLAFEYPVTEDMTQTMLVRMGIVPADGKPPTPEEVRRNAEAVRRFPDLDLSLEMMVRRMVGLLFIEVSAFHTFAWAEEVLSDTELLAGDGRAAELVRFIRADETPHVEYLRTALTEMRDRTFVGESGATVSGANVIGTLWDTALEQSLGANRESFLRTATAEVEHAIASHPRRDDILDRFRALGSEAGSGVLA
ncbi:MAG: hypothetical protein M3Q30_08420 [Actinomycetota bacterium]|nr:hypothetical protein [Actinomycetota bacterium]